MAQIYFVDSGYERPWYEIHLDDPETVTADEATRRDRDWLQNLVTEFLRVKAREFNDQAIREAIFRAKVGTAGKFGDALTNFTLA